ncbi:MAG: hypothetical protein ABEN55_20490, partial [Bradymonadaceae bacterium]
MVELPENLQNPVQALPVAGQTGPELTAFVLAVVAASGVIWASGYLLWMWRRVMFGPLDND